MPPPEVPADFLARVNARIDETAGWFGLADFRLWTLRLAPAAAALALDRGPLARRRLASRTAASTVGDVRAGRDASAPRPPPTGSRT